MAEEYVGTVSHYFSNARVAAVEISEGRLRVGDTIHVLGNTSDFTQKINSMQINRAPVRHARPGDSIGIQVMEQARKNDKVYRVIAEEAGQGGMEMGA
jgi:putative protease